VRIFALVPEAHGGHGGIAKYDRDFLEAMATCPRVDEIVVLPRLLREDPGPLPHKLTYVVGGVGGKGRYVLTAMREMLLPGGAELVLCGHLNLLPVALIAAKRFRAPLAVVLYGIDAWTPPPSRAARSALPRVDDVVSISTTTLGRFRSWGVTPRAAEHILPNAFDPRAFAPGPKPKDLEQRYGLLGKTVLMTFGRMEAAERYKGFDEMMELLPRLQRENREKRVVYLAVGDGNDRPRLEERARRLGLANDVVFTGRISEAEKAAHYRLADAYVMPSYGEGFGFVFLEAMACGIPVVASRADGSREAVRDGMLGLLVDPKNPDEIAAAVTKALAMPRGVVPFGLSYFEWPEFEKRVHTFVDAATKR